MRARIIFPVLGIAMLVVGLALLFRRGDAASSALAPDAVFVTAAANSPVVGRPVFSRALAEAPAKESSQPDDNAASLEALRIEYSFKRIAQLRQLAVTGDANALNTILPELSDRDPGIRQAALAGATEFGDRAALPALNEALESEPDSQEQANIKKAIAYLELPTLNEQDRREAGLSSAAGSSPASIN